MNDNELIRCPNRPCPFKAKDVFSFRRHTCSFAKKLGRNFQINYSNYNQLQQVKGNMDTEIPVQTEVYSEEFGNAISNERKFNEMDNALQKAPDHVIQIATRLCSLSGDRKSEDNINDILKLISCNANISEQVAEYIPTVSKCKNLCGSNMTEKLESDIFQKVKVHGEMEDGETAYLYVKDVLKLLRRQVEVLESSEFQFELMDTEDDENKTHIMQSEYVAKIISEKRKSVMKSGDPSIMWRDGRCGAKSFAGLLQLFSDKTFATLKAGSFSAYALHICFLNVSRKARQFLIDNGYTLLGFLPTKSQNEKSNEATYEFTLENVEFEPLEDELKTMSDRDGRSKNMEILHEAMAQAIEPIAKLHLEGFTIITKECTWICHPILFSYCCDIPEAKDIFSIRHGINTNRPCVNCLCTSDKMKKLEVDKARTIDDTAHVRSEGVETERRADTKKEKMGKLKERSLGEYKSFLEVIYEKYSSFIVRDIYSIYTFECLHNLLLGISPLLKICLFKYLSSDFEVDTFKYGDTVRMKISSLKENLLRAGNSILSNIDEKYPMNGKRVDFSRQEYRTGINGLFLKTGVRGMLEGKDWKNIDMVFPFVAAFVDKMSGCRKGGLLTKVNVQYTEILHDVYYNFPAEGVTESDIMLLKQKITSFQKGCIKLFGESCKTGLHTLKFHMLHHLAENVEKYIDVTLMEGSPYEHFNLLIKKEYWGTSKRMKTVMDETASRIGHATTKMYENKVKSCHSERVPTKRMRATEAYLVSTGEVVPLRAILNYAENTEYAISGTREETVSMVPTIIKNLKKSHISKFLDLIKEEIKERNNGQMTYEMQWKTKLTIVKSGFVDGCKAPSLVDYDKERNIVKIRGVKEVTGMTHRIFATESFGSNETPKYSFVCMKGGSTEHPEYYFAKVILLLRIDFHNGQQQAEYAFVQYMKCTPPKDIIDKGLGCVCLRFETEDEIDYSLKPLPKEEDTITAGEWFGLEPVESIFGAIHVLRSNMHIPPFVGQVPWTHQRFYVNRFYH